MVQRENDLFALWCFLNIGGQWSVFRWKFQSVASHRACGSACNLYREAFISVSVNLQRFLSAQCERESVCLYVSPAV